MVVRIALSLLLLVTTGLVRTLSNLQGMDAGFIGTTANVFSHRRSAGYAHNGFLGLQTRLVRSQGVVTFSCSATLRSTRKLHGSSKYEHCHAEFCSTAVRACRLRG